MMKLGRGDVHKIYGPPGTGKTSTLLRLLSTCIDDGFHPYEIGLVTFSNQAANIAKSRISWVSDYIGTLHAMCFQDLGLRKEQVVDLKVFGEKIGYSLHGCGEVSDIPATPAETIIRAHNRDRTYISGWDNGRPPAVHLENFPDSDPKFVKWVIGMYTAWKSGYGYLDFVDMLEFYAREGNPLPIRILAIDEAQDLSGLQWRVVERMAQHCDRVYVAGDDDQAIYEWAGANRKQFVNLPATYTEVLDRSYRLPKTIHTFAWEIAHRIKDRVPKAYLPTDKEGSIHYALNLADCPLNGSTLILHRNVYQIAATQRYLNQEGIPYQGEIFNAEQRHLIQDWERWSVEPLPATTIRKFFSYCTRETVPRDTRIIFEGIDDVDKITRREATNAGIPNVSWSLALTKLKGIDTIQKAILTYGYSTVILNPPLCTVSTIHAAKGGEADRVIITTDMTTRTQKGYHEDPDAEHRVWYTGVTRAKKELYIIHGSYGEYRL